MRWSTSIPAAVGETGGVVAAVVVAAAEASVAGSRGHPKATNSLENEGQGLQSRTVGYIA